MNDGSRTFLRDKSLWSFFAVCSAFLPAFCENPPAISQACQSPLLYEDLGDNPNSGDNQDVRVMCLSGATTTICATGGETTPPHNGDGQWFSLPIVEYEWHVEGTEGLLSVNNGDVTDGDGTTDPSVTAYLENPGTIDIQVQMRRQYQNGSKTKWSDWTPQ